MNLSSGLESTHKAWGCDPHKHAKYHRTVTLGSDYPVSYRMAWPLPTLHLREETQLLVSLTIMPRPHPFQSLIHRSSLFLYLNFSSMDTLPPATMRIAFKARASRPELGMYTVCASSWVWTLRTPPHPKKDSIQISSLPCHWLWYKQMK